MRKLGAANRVKNRATRIPFVFAAILITACGNDDTNASGTDAGKGGAGGSSFDSGLGDAKKPGASGTGTHSGGAPSGGSSGASGGSSADAAAGGGGATNGGSGGTAGSAGDASTGAGGRDGGARGRCTPVNDQPGPMTSGPALTDAERGESYTAIDAFLIGRTVHADSQADAESIRAAVQGMPHVHDTGVAADCTVWVRFTDGSPFSLFNDGRDPNANLDAGLPLLQPPSLPVPSSHDLIGAPPSPSTFSLPASGTARIGYSDNLAVSALPHVLAALDKRGYNVSVGMTTADLRGGVVGLGVLWLSTHGAFTEKDSKGNTHFAIATDELVDSHCALSASACDQNRTDMNAGLAGVGQLTTAPFKKIFGINEAWVRTYWTFAANSFVFIDACSSMSPLPEAKAFVAALKAQKAGTVLGWTGVTNAGFARDAADFLFDRVLGGNKDGIHPPQRPFSLQEVLGVMQSRGMAADPNNPGTTLLSDPAFSDLILAPSIRNLTIGDTTVAIDQRVTEMKTGTELTLEGEFAPARGAVEIGCLDPPACKTGAPAPPKASPTSTQAIVTLTNTGSGSSGFVRMKVAAGSQTLTSNAVPLTSWRGTLDGKYTNLHLNAAGAGPPGTTIELICSAAHFRTDIHPFRFAPEESAAPGMVDASGQRGTLIRMPGSVADTQCSGNISGSFNPGAVTDLTAASKAITWISNDPADQPQVPTWWYHLAPEIDASNPSTLPFKLIAASDLCTDGVVHYPAPVGDQPFKNFCDDMGFATFPQVQPPNQLNPTTFGVTLPKKSYKCGVTNVDDCELQYALQPESSTVPTADTEG